MRCQGEPSDKFRHGASLSDDELDELFDAYDTLKEGWVLTDEEMSILRQHYAMSIRWHSYREQLFRRDKRLQRALGQLLRAIDREGEIGDEYLYGMRVLDETRERG